jgi:hypothetical protein
VDLAGPLEYVGSAALRPVPAEFHDDLGAPAGAELVAAVAGTEPVSAAQAGADGYRLRVACAADGLASAALPVPPDAAARLGLALGQVVVALLAIGHPAAEA